MLKELVEYIARGLVDDPTAVQVTERRSGDRVTIYLQVGEHDMGKVIGKQGRIAHAIRGLMKVAAMQEDVRVALEIG
jgi:predicted RNA-binding protein YlqC (UPF0109 family)